MKNAHRGLYLLSKASILTVKLKEEGVKGIRIEYILYAFKAKKHIKESTFQVVPPISQKFKLKESKIATTMMKMNLTFLRELKNKFTARECIIRDRISNILKLSLLSKIRIVGLEWILPHFIIRVNSATKIKDGLLSPLSKIEKRKKEIIMMMKRIEHLKKT